MKKLDKNKNQQEQNNNDELVDENYGYEKPSFDFFGKKYLTEKGRMLVNLKVISVIAAFQTFIIFVLLYGYINLSNRLNTTIMIPDYGIVEVAKMKANPLYYKVWGDYVLTRVANFEPTTIASRANAAKTIFDARAWEIQKVFLEKYIKVIEKNQISQTFKFADSDVKFKMQENGGKITITYSGVAEQKVANLAKPRIIKCHYKFGFFVSNGKPFQDSIYTNCLMGGDEGSLSNIKGKNPKNSDS